MRAAVYERFGPPEVVRVVEVDKPVPGDAEVLIRVRASTVTSAECLMRTGRPLWGRVVLGLRRPRRKMRGLGLELAGEIESVGRDVRRFRRGDEVFGFVGFNIGACADYKCLPEKASLALKPANTTYEEAAAAVDGATTALFFLRDKGKIRSGEKVLVNGASGSIGTYAVQLAKHFGAEVTGVCSGRNAELVRSLGADHVIDHTREDFPRNGVRYDIIFDTVGRSSFTACRGSLSSTGRYLATTGLINYPLAVWTRLRSGPRVISGMSVQKNTALTFLRDLIESDQLRIIIDRRYPLEQIVDAHRYVETGHKTGNVVISLHT
jgi:NADPH:quinone reductase-like Zn-dependent oxidoreductase